jgi:hypothetical protein
VNALNVLPSFVALELLTVVASSQIYPTVFTRCTVFAAATSDYFSTINAFEVLIAAAVNVLPRFGALKRVAVVVTELFHLTVWASCA